MLLTVKWLQSLGLKLQGQIRVASPARLQYTYANRAHTS